MGRFEDWRYPEIKENEDTKWGWRVKGVDNFKMGENVDIGYGTYIQAEAGVEIGDNVQIGGGVKIYSLDTIDGKNGKIIIKNDACIGANAVILPNVIIESGEKIKALSVVWVSKDNQRRIK